MPKAATSPFKSRTPEYNRWYQKRLRDANSNRIKGYKLKESFGITMEQYNEMVASQNNKCAICKKPETVKLKKTNTTKRLAVDHCHVSGKVRGLLCMNCNQGIGKFKDNIALLNDAINYLKQQEI